ncbi:MAG: diacylglycerol kinase family lipid kinase [Oscillochloris sp.]|nr:diacylglycerol kinase family lipid kinase [Oscillochloris sp.]
MPNTSETISAAPTAHKQKHIFVLLNPGSSRANPATLRATIERVFSLADVRYSVHTTEEGENLPATVRKAVEAGHTHVVAAGGDGTVSAVADGLLDSDACMAIVPIGTANVLARELRIPLNPEHALGLLVQAHTEVTLDVMRFRDRIAVLQIGIGLGSVMIRDTQPWAKRIIGRSAYLGTAFMRFFGFEPRRFTIEVDDETHRTAAMHVVIANGGVMGTRPFRWGPNIVPTDGMVDVAILSARTARDALKLVWIMLSGKQRRSRDVRYLRAGRRIKVTASPELPIQADGEIIGTTPIEVQVVKSAVRVVVPHEYELEAAEDT